VRIYYTTKLPTIKENSLQNFIIAREPNLRLTGGKVVWGEEKNSDNWPKTQWAAVEAAHAKIGKIEDSVIVVSLYNAARTIFEQNC